MRRSPNTRRLFIFPLGVEDMVDDLTVSEVKMNIQRFASSLPKLTNLSFLSVDERLSITRAKKVAVPTN